MISKAVGMECRACDSHPTQSARNLVSHPLDRCVWRMKPDAYTEISGVCSHPDYRGRGYAGELTRLAAKRIIMRGEIPFLHVFAANTSAIKLYEKLGFVLRRAQ